MGSALHSSRILISVSAFIEKTSVNVQNGIERSNSRYSVNVSYMDFDEKGRYRLEGPRSLFVTC